MSGWRDISTAPKDGTRIIAATDGHVLAVRWNAGRSEWEDDDGWSPRGLQPTHWMPLPEPPVRP